MSVQLKVWLDDIRPAPEGWVWLDNVEDVIKLLSIFSTTIDGKNNLVKELSLDNDLGNGKEEGYKVMYWLEQMVAENPSFTPPKTEFHTANPVAKIVMQRTKEAMERFIHTRNVKTYMGKKEEGKTKC